MKISIENKIESDSKKRNNDVKLKIIPKIIPLPNGPLYLLNNVEPMVVDNLQNSRREMLFNVRGVALCRCGAF